MAKIKLSDTGERMIPEMHQGKLIYGEHLTRYLATQGLVKGKTVLDIACGSGYGTKLIAKYAKKVYGVDVDYDSVEYARQNFAGKNIEFSVGDATKIPLDNDSVDVVVTFETIEHVKNYKQFLSEINRVLSPDGLAIVSTPNDLEFAEGNHFHLHEFKYKELLDLLKKDYKYVETYFQATWKSVLIGRDNLMNRQGQIDLQVLNYSPVSPDQYLYFYFLCSNRPITEEIEPILALGEHYSDREFIGMQMTNEKNLSDYKKVVDELKGEVGRLTETNQALSGRLSKITDTKSYRLASKVHRAKSKLTNGKKNS